MEYTKLYLFYQNTLHSSLCYKQIKFVRLKKISGLCHCARSDKPKLIVIGKSDKPNFKWLRMNSL